MPNEPTFTPPTAAQLAALEEFQATLDAQVQKLRAAGLPELPIMGSLLGVAAGIAINAGMTVDQLIGPLRTTFGVIAQAVKAGPT